MTWPAIKATLPVARKVWHPKSHDPHVAHLGVIFENPDDGKIYVDAVLKHVERILDELNGEKIAEKIDSIL